MTVRRRTSLSLLKKFEFTKLPDDEIEDDDDEEDDDGSL
jgi:hypothetical protein